MTTVAKFVQISQRDQLSCVLAQLYSIPALFYQSNAINTATSTRSHADEYGMKRVDTIEPLDPLSICATSPSFVTVDVAAGASTIVLVIVIGDPTLLVPEYDIEVELAADVAILLAVASRDVPTIEALRIRMHPFGEHMSFFGQHPPPAAAGHSTIDARHLGGRDSEV